MLFATAATAALAVVTAGAVSAHAASVAVADTYVYGMAMSSSRNKLHSYTGDTGYSGDATLKTNLGNEIGFSYSAVKGIASTWHVLGADGYFRNTDPIHGLSKIVLTFNTDAASFDVLYSSDSSLSSVEHLTSSTSSSVEYNFENTYPAFFKVLNTSGSDLDVSSVTLSFTCQSAEEAWKVSHGVVPALSEDGKSLTYGLYPQTRVVDEALVSALDALDAPESNGWYLYDGEYYAKQTAKPYKYIDNPVFDDGTTIVSGTSYWFLCEPIAWDVLSNSDGSYYVVSDALLDAHCYNYTEGSRTVSGSTVYGNNYEYSEIRAWLNGYDGSGYGVSDFSGAGFLDAAFSLGSSYIETTEVDNSAATTNSNTNKYACENTFDRVFLPSYRDYLNADYGFSTSRSVFDLARRCRTTDFARARGAYYSTDSSYLYNGHYWTRSPYNGGSYYARYVSDVGGIAQALVTHSHSSVRPGLVLNVSE